MAMPEYVYHYTSEEGLNGILRDRRIKTSQNTTRDAYYGIGVYFTDVRPGDLDDNKLVAVLYNRAYQSRMKRVQICTRFKSSWLPGLKAAEEEKRTVYVVDQDIDIDKFGAQIMRRSPITNRWTGQWENP